ncbi:right-handed parallel beta-helix repeat-containing protein [Spirillospora sp. CA-255316]
MLPRVPTAVIPAVAVAAATVAAVAVAFPGTARAAAQVVREPGTGCPAPTVTVADPARLAAALAGARPGDVIRIADGTYDGNWTATTPGTEAKPIWLCGGPDAVLTNGGHRGGYGLHLNGASWWHVRGLSVTRARKGVVVDAAERVTLERLNVHDLGEEGIHLRRHTTDSFVTGNTVYGTGRADPQWGEGVHIGSADVDWPVHTGGLPDRSDRNTVAGNTIHGTTAEPIEVKEGSSGGLAVGNVLDAGALTGPGGDSCGDVMGNDWVFSHNICTGSRADGWQTHRKRIGGQWGLRTIFTGNEVALAGGSSSGYGFRIEAQEEAFAVVRCDNTVTGGAFANVGCAAAAGGPPVPARRPAGSPVRHAGSAVRDGSAR